MNKEIEWITVRGESLELLQKSVEGYQRVGFVPKLDNLHLDIIGRQTILMTDNKDYVWYYQMEMIKRFFILMMTGEE